MNQSLSQGVLRFVTLFSFEVAALAMAVQSFIWLDGGSWHWVSPGDVLMRVGIGPPPPEWMNGSVYDMLWQEPLVLTSLAAGVIAMTYAAIAQYEADEESGHWSRP